MTMEILRTASIPHIRGGIVAAKLDLELAKIHADCVDRSLLKKPRKVTLEIFITPQGDDPLEGVETEFRVSQAVLPPTVIVRQMKSAGKRNGFAFDSDTDSIDHDVMQRRLTGIDGDEENE